MPGTGSEDGIENFGTVDTGSGNDSIETVGEF
jgi:hypothetical protein